MSIATSSIAVANQDKAIPKLLVTVNTDHAEHVALNKAHALAQRFGSDIHMVTSVYDPVTQYADFLSVDDYTQIKNGLLHTQEEKLEPLTQHLEDDGVSAIAHVRYAENIALAIETLGESVNPTFVIKRKSEDINLVNPFATAIDRECIRSTTRPLWLVDDIERDYHKIIIAIDPTVADEEHLLLNQRIVTISKLLTEQLSATVEYLHVYEPPVQSVGFELVALNTATLVENVDAKHQKDMQDFAELHDLDPEHCHVHMNQIEYGIADFCDESAADLLVMGTAGRSGLSAFFIGNTAEEVLSKVHCEVICVPA